jgi:muconate cycloisomerase
MPGAKINYPTKLEIYRSEIPTRGFSHAAASRDKAEAVVVCQHFADGQAGWGETLPRPYVTGETLDSVLADLQNHLWDPWVKWWSSQEACPDLAALTAAPATQSPDGRCNLAARAVLEHSALPALTLPPLARRISARVSGVLGSADPDRTARKLRQMRLIRLRDYKLKVGFGSDIDQANLAMVCRQLGRCMKAGRCTLRVDANGGWGIEETPHRVEEMARMGVCAVEQPVYVPAEKLVELSHRCPLPLIADESLLSFADAVTLAEAGDRIWWNVRIAKNGGPASALQLCRMADEAGTTLVLGCMVGESSLLSACQRALLQWGACPRFVEGNYGRFLLKGDLTRRSLTFGLGGRLRALRPAGLIRQHPSGRALANRMTHIATLQSE